MTAAVTVRKNGFAEMAFVGNRLEIWHRLGNELKPGASIEEWQKSAGMDFTVKRSKVRFATGTDQPHEQMEVMDDTHILFRNDNHKPLGVVSNKYKVVQPGEVLEFFKDLVAGNGYELSTAGTLFDGKRFWALASIGEEAVVVGRDNMKGFLLLSTSCDGSLATTAKFTTIRVVCNNTLSMALRSAVKSEVNVSHRSVFNAETVKEKLGLARGNFREFMVAARALAGHQIKKEAAGNFVEELLLSTKTIFSQKPRETRQFKTVMELFEGKGMGAELTGAEGTLWGLLNGVTEYVDHQAKGKTPSHQLANAWFGRGDELKTAALEKALALV